MSKKTTIPEVKLSKEERAKLEGELILLLPNSNAWKTFDDASLVMFHKSCYDKKTGVKALAKNTKIKGVSKSLSSNQLKR
jgi:hypothetical protein